jgi:hypothetical protein
MKVPGSEDWPGQRLGIDKPIAPPVTVCRNRRLIIFES